MGDVLALVENVTKTVDREQAEKLARKLKKGKDFDLEDLHDQLQQVEKMGGLSTLIDKLPAHLAGKAAQAPQANDKEIKRQMAVIRSMTPGERRYPKTIDASRKRRIAWAAVSEVKSRIAEPASPAIVVPEFTRLPGRIRESIVASSSRHAFTRAGSKTRLSEWRRSTDSAIVPLRIS